LENTWAIESRRRKAEEAPGRAIEGGGMEEEAGQGLREPRAVGGVRDVDAPRSGDGLEAAKGRGLPATDSCRCRRRPSPSRRGGVP